MTEFKNLSLPGHWCFLAYKITIIQEYYITTNLGVTGSLIEWFKDYLNDRYQRVVINGQASTLRLIPAGVPQGSVLGPLLFLLYINDIVFAVQNCQIRMFADDTCLFMEVDNRDECTEMINEDLQLISDWANKWLVTFSTAKTKSLLISNKPDADSLPPVFMNNDRIEEVTVIPMAYIFKALTMG